MNGRHAWRRRRRGGRGRTVVVSPESLSLKVEERRTKKEER